MSSLYRIPLVALASLALAFAMGCDDEETTEDPTTTDSGVTAGSGGGGENPAGSAGEAGAGGGGELPGGGGGDAGSAGGEEPPAGGGGDAGSAGGVDPNADTDPMGATTEWGPASRLTSLDIPGSVDDAIAAGCTVQGNKYGSSLGGLLALASMIPGAPPIPEGEPILDAYLNPDENGEIALIMLAQLAGWAEGQTGNDVATADLRFFMGELMEDKFYIDPAAFIDSDPANDPLVHFEASTSGGMLSTAPAPYYIEMPVMEGLTIAVSLIQAEVFGSLTVEGGGWGANGVIQGYITRDGLMTLAEALRDACSGDAPPSFCAQAAGFGIDVNNPEAVVTFFTNLVTLDAFVENEMPATCTGEGGDRTCCPPEGCNSISVCLPAVMSPAEIAGLATAP